MGPSMSAVGVTIPAVKSSAPSALAVEVDTGLGLPVAYGGLRKLLTELGAHAPHVLETAARANPAYWNCLFPPS
jgi:hypothetical protein